MVVAAAEAVMEAVVVRERFAWRILMGHIIYYIFLCLEHEQIKFESLTFSLLDTSWICLRTLEMGIYTYVHINTNYMCMYFFERGITNVMT